MSTDNSTISRVSNRKYTYFILILLSLLGIALMWIGSKYFEDGSFGRSFLLGLGTAMAPSSIIGTVLKYFLFQDIRVELTDPLISSVREKVSPLMEETIKDTVKEYQKEIGALQQLKCAGITGTYPNRIKALNEFAEEIKFESEEIIIIGSSLEGLFKNKSCKGFLDALEAKIVSQSVDIQFLLTHPKFADFRASQEKNEFQEIGKQIINSLRRLQDWKVPVENVKLFKGTPTCFSIKTSRSMLINPYPYCNVAYNSPCFIITNPEEQSAFMYNAFLDSHFKVWDSPLAESIQNYDDTINKLSNNLNTYAASAKKFLNN